MASLVFIVCQVYQKFTVWLREGGAVLVELGGNDLCGGPGAILLSAAYNFILFCKETKNGHTGLPGQPGLTKSHTV